MQESINIRNAIAQDLPQIVAIYNQTIASRQVTADLEPVTVAQRQGWFRAHNAATRPLWVVESSHLPGEPPSVIAWVSWQDFYGRLAYGATAELSIYIDRFHRQQGLGSELLQRAIAHSPRLGLQNLLGFVFAHNLPSVRLFEKAGFQEWGYLPRVALLDQVERDLVIFGKRL